MCGIAFAARPATGQTCVAFEAAWTATKASVQPRGPDSAREVRFVIKPSEPNDSAGADPQGIELLFFASVLHMRGKDVVDQPISDPATSRLLIWNGEIFEGLNIPEDRNDGLAVFQAISDDERCFDLPVAVVDNPFAFVHYSPRQRWVTLGRDPLGRRSLNIIEPSDSSGIPFILAASCFLDTSLSSQAQELPTDSVLRLDFSGDRLLKQFKGRNLPTTRLSAVQPSPAQLLTEDRLKDLPVEFLEACLAFESFLSDAVRRRVASLPHHAAASSSTLLPARVAVLFSGGIDCTVLALLAHRHLPFEERIDLLNVAFEQQPGDGFDVPDRLTAREAVQELRRIAPSRAWRLVEVDVLKEEYSRERPRIVELTKPQDTVMDLSISAALYFAARGQGSILVDDNRVAFRSGARCLFSGLGADELLGGYSRHRAAFFSGPPDANETASGSHKASPARQQRKRPRKSGGQDCNWTALIAELQMDLDRLPTRNLGRDDRVISFHGREVRYPFLDARVIRHLAQTPVWIKCDHGLGAGVGDKLVLRLVAQRMGLAETSRRVKRAIQFGARSAKLDGTRSGADRVDDGSERADADTIPGGVVDGSKPPPIPKTKGVPKLANLAKSLAPTVNDEPLGLSPEDFGLMATNYATPRKAQVVMLGYPTHHTVVRHKVSHIRSLNNPSPPHVRIAPVPGKGFGVIAAANIPCGALIFAERPLIIMPEKIKAPRYEVLEGLYMSVFAQLADESRRTIMGLATSSHEPDAHPIVARINANEISLELPIELADDGTISKTYSYTGVFPQISRHNHSCAPNARWHFDHHSIESGGTFSLRLHAVRDIKAGEEVTVSYIEHLKSRWDRTSYLFARWGFDCCCEACGSKPMSEMEGEKKQGELKRVQESNERRERLGKLEAFFLELVRSLRHREVFYGDVEATVARAEEAIQTIAEEGLHEEKELFQRAIALLWCQQGPQTKTQAMQAGKGALLMVGAVKGEESDLWQEMFAISQGRSWDEVFPPSPLAAA